ncbi:unnamed protein product [Caenorhabditis angaria]|uniref:RGS domain-containing protein n=1 Tax=Caenorhabditis angaria TaxID=860376 RepID=A0A9P1MW84_9PELO|nr:unnamed protein product [Caenorhabditis angaria]
MFPNNLITTPPVNFILEDKNFLHWAKQEESRETDSINLYLAITDFEKRLESNKVPELALVKLARHIHRKFVSLNTGSCSFLETPLRTQQSTRIHELLEGKLPYKSLFDPLKPSITKMISSKYSEFTLRRKPDIPKVESWQSASSSNSEKQGAYIWFNEDAIDQSSRHELGTTIAHENEDDRFAFFNEVCNRLNDLQDIHTSNISSPKDSRSSQSSKMSPYGIDGFAPPPPISLQPPNNLPKRFESLYRKKRQQKSETSSGFGSAATDSYSEKFRSLDRTNRNNIINNGFLTLQPKKSRAPRQIPFLQIELRYENDVPMVARIQNQAVTFRYFRHLFGVDYNDNCRFFFKSICEDNSASYQWTLILNDDDILPLFQDRITAICRLCPSSDLI